MTRVTVACVIAATLFFTGPSGPFAPVPLRAAAAPQFPRIPSGLGGLVRRLPGLDDFLKPGPVLTTSMGDASGRLGPLPDGVESGHFASLFSLPRGPRGEFVLRPGRYSAFVESFCLQPGAHASTHGDGFAMAPLKGPWATIFEDVIRGAARVPSVPQENLQVLLWGMLARTKISVMPRELQVAAAAVLSPKELLQVNGGALGLVPQSVIDTAVDRLPDGAREAFQAESSIRQMLADGVSSYEEIERRAVPDADEARNAGLDVSVDEWIDTGRGYYLRFLPLGYRNVRVEVIVPPRAAGRQAGLDGGGTGPVLRLAAWSPAVQPQPGPAATPTLDLSALVAVPADNGQRLGLTTRPSKDVAPTEDDDWSTSKTERASGDERSPGNNGSGLPPPLSRSVGKAPAGNTPAAAAASATPAVIALDEPISVSDQVAPPLPAVAVTINERIGIGDTVRPPVPAAVIKIDERIQVGDIAGAPRQKQQTR